MSDFGVGYKDKYGMGPVFHRLSTPPSFGIGSHSPLGATPFLFCAVLVSIKQRALVPSQELDTSLSLGQVDSSIGLLSRGTKMEDDWHSGY